MTSRCCISPVNLLILWLLVLWPVTAPVFGQEVTDSDGQMDRVYLSEILERTGARLEWDPYREQGALVRGDTIVTFSVGSEIAVVDLNLIEEISPPARRDGSLVFSRDFLSFALGLFPPREQMRRIAAIYIDPGHGGKDPGAVGSGPGGSADDRLEEKDVVLDVGLRLRDLLAERYPDREIVMSRDSDRYLTLEERTTIANAIETGPTETVVFLSLHANASLNRAARGFEVWFLPPEFRRRDLVNAEEAGVSDPDLLSILNTMREEEITIESILLARNVLAGIEARVGDRSPNRGLREESWYVVRNAKMPSVLVEVGFVTNAEEAANLRNTAYLQEITEGIYTGVNNFVRSYEELGTE
ncbi:MAG: N-acetylmuramoyl-L-alanine amidase [Spirochaeta sp.]|jgi:N-acetylmuramoyl-L-alanine amidase|nr:N-acetylmuramoyl-L-alanine amidase [Spirochaeta sp.]